MPVPADQNFDALSGPLGSSSATFDGVTYFNSDPFAGLSVTGGVFDLGDSTFSQTTIGFRTADGSDFKFESFALLATAAGFYGIEGYRDGVLVAGSGFNLPSAGGFTLTTGGIFSYVDEIRLIAPDNRDIRIDNLDFSAPVITHVAPTIANLQGNAVNYSEGAAPVLIDANSDAVIADSDTFVFDGGRLAVAITGGSVPAEDVLGIATGSGVSLSGALANGVTVFVGATAIGTVTSNGAGGNELAIDFNASANATNVTTLLRSVTYANSNTDNPDGVARTITTSFSNLSGDATSQNVSVTSTVNVTGVDDPAVARNDTVTLAENAVLSGASVFTDHGAGADSDPDSALTVMAVNGVGANIGTRITLASGALLTLHARGDFDYDPNGAFDDLPGAGSGASNLTRTDSFTYTLNGGDTATVTVTVTGVDSDDVVQGSASGDALFGQNFNDQLFGFGGNDTLDGGSGDDELFGSAGADTLIGGLGNDTMTGGTHGDLYYVREAGDVVVELTGAGGLDCVAASISYTLAADAEIERLNTTSSARIADIDLTGNAFSQQIFGNAGANILDGKGGSDTLIGGLGDDILVGGTGADVLNGGDGSDTASYATATTRVVASLANPGINIGDAAGDTYNSVENLTGTKFTDALNGSNSVNVIDGGGGNDIIKGYGGNDTLTGGTGQDVFIFSAALDAATNVDEITDFSVADDTIRLDDLVFAALGAPGVLTASAFHIGTQAADAGDRLVYDDVTGALSYDADGLGGAAGIQFATLTGGLALTNADFSVA